MVLVCFDWLGGIKNGHSTCGALMSMVVRYLSLPFCLEGTRTHDLEDLSLFSFMGKAWPQ